VLENATSGSTITTPKSTSIFENFVGWIAKVYAIGLIWTGVYWIVTRDKFINVEITSWIKFGVILSAVIVCAIVATIGNRSTTERDKITRAFVALIAVPLVIFDLVVLTSGNEKEVIKIVFLTAAIFLPPGLYIVFVASRRASILNSFVTTLYQMGLIQRQDWREETESVRRTRVRSYLERFGAQYGRVSDSYVEQFLSATDSGRPGSIGRKAPEFPEVQESAVPLDFRTVIPVGFCVAFLTVGWLILLSPFTDSVTLEEPPKSALGFAFLGAYFFSL
jgi:hypothetical protein